MGQVRIIGGQWRRRTLQVPDRPGLRPTPDRARETVFNWLESWLPYQWSDTRVLDAFAGSGALGIESASRGAQQVILVDSDRIATQCIQTAIDDLRA
ncbi:MAG: RsmD family RNA methyltransferase, partial [Burkholderiaceae bacterium]